MNILLFLIKLEHMCDFALDLNCDKLLSSEGQEVHLHFAHCWSLMHPAVRICTNLIVLAESQVYLGSHTVSDQLAENGIY
jgi:hypothetical protein